MPPALRFSPQQLEAARPGDPSDRYWRTPQYIIALQHSVADTRALLKDHNYPSSAPASEFETLLRRLARSLPAYEKCKIAELRAFAQQRGIAIHNNSRRDLVEALRRADDEPRFTRFLNLPVELREWIYRLYCSEFADEALHLPTWPPLARVSKLLAEEMLKVFYGECTFGVALTTESALREHRKLRMQRDTTLFFRSLKPEHLACIQKLELVFEQRRAAQQQGFRRLEVRVCVPRKGGEEATARAIVRSTVSGSVVDKSFAPWGSGNYDAGQLRELEDLVVEFCEEVKKRDGGQNHLLLDDVYGLRRLLEDFFARDEE